MYKRQVGRAQLTYKLGGVDGDGLLCVASLSLLEARRHHVVWNQVPAQQPSRHVVVVVRLLRHRIVSGEVLAGTEIPEGNGGGEGELCLAPLCHHQNDSAFRWAEV